MLASITANFSMCRPKEPLTPDDFMPKRNVREKTDAELAEEFAAQLNLIAFRAPISKLPD